MITGLKRLDKGFRDVRREWEEFAPSYGDFKSPIRLITLTKSLNKHKISLQDKEIVEHGCANGLLTMELLSIAKFVRGVDFSANLLAEAQRRLMGRNGYTLSPIIRDFSILTDLSADVVLCVSMLEHLPEDMVTRTVQDAYRVLRKGGYLILKLPTDSEHWISRSPISPALDRVIWEPSEIEVMADTYRFDIIEINEFGILRKR